MHQVARGALAGLTGTGMMTLAIAAARAAGLLRTPPPAEITARAQEKAADTMGARPRAAGPPFEAGWLAAHFAYGAACGVGYALIRPLVPAPPVGIGLAYGGAVWGLSYLGLMPALGLYPWPDDDSRSRMAATIAAHAVFGVATAEAERRLAAR